MERHGRNVRFISFFAGIGGFDLGLERAGHECVAQVEIDPYALRVLERHWPGVARFGDIRTLDASALPVVPQVVEAIARKVWG